MRHLNLYGCIHIGDAGVKVLAEQCNELQSLDICYCDLVGNEGFRALLQCNKLQSVQISGTSITEDCIEEVKISGTSITEDCIEEFKGTGVANSEQSTDVFQ